MALYLSLDLQRDIDAGTPSTQAQIWLSPPLPKTHKERQAQIVGVLKRVAVQTGVRPNRVELVRRQSDEPGTTFWIDAPAAYVAALIVEPDVHTAWTARNIQMLDKNLIVKQVDPRAPGGWKLKTLRVWPLRHTPAALRRGRELKLDL